MELTAAASFLNSAFAGYDRMILSLLHKCSNGFFTFLFKLITLLGEKGILFFLAALIFMCFPKTRKLSVCIFGAVCCGALITSIILKDAVARPRPLTVMPYLQWWTEIAGPVEDGFSFPSGHVTAAAAGAVAIRLIKGKKWTWPAVAWVVIMMIARNYLMAHYPTDVLAGAIVGTASAFISFYITEFIFRFLYINRRKKWCGLVLEWSAPDFYGVPSMLGLTGKADAKQFAFPSEKKNAASPSEKKSTSPVGSESAAPASGEPEFSSVEDEAPAAPAAKAADDFFADMQEAAAPAAEEKPADDFFFAPAEASAPHTDADAEEAIASEPEEFTISGDTEADFTPEASHVAGKPAGFSLDRLKEVSKDLSSRLGKAAQKASGTVEKISHTGKNISKMTTSTGYKGKHEK